jgi:hypothetical protein
MHDETELNPDMYIPPDVGRFMFSDAKANPRMSDHALHFAILRIALNSHINL